MCVYIYIYIYIYVYIYIYIYIYIYVLLPRRAVSWWPPPASRPREACRKEWRLHRGCERSAADLRTEILDFRGFDASRIINLRGGILMYIGHSNRYKHNVIRRTSVCRPPSACTPLRYAEGWPAFAQSDACGEMCLDLRVIIIMLFYAVVVLFDACGRRLLAGCPAGPWSRFATQRRTPRQRQIGSCIAWVALLV